MTFKSKPDEYFVGLIRQPGGSGERVVVRRGSRVATVKATVTAALSMNWDWLIELCRDTGDLDQPSELIESWSSLVGELPPAVRPVVL